MPNVVENKNTQLRVYLSNLQWDSKQTCTPILLLQSLQNVVNLTFARTYVHVYKRPCINFNHFFTKLCSEDIPIHTIL